MLPIIPVKVTATKEARASAVTPLCEAGKVVLPEAAPWLEDWIEEHVAFPTGRHDDQVDTTSMALERLAGFGRRPEDFPSMRIIGVYNEAELGRRSIFAEEPRPRRILEPFDPEGYDPRRVPSGSIFEARESGW
jgi:hypothetical protein